MKTALHIGLPVAVQRVMWRLKVPALHSNSEQSKSSC